MGSRVRLKPDSAGKDRILKRSCSEGRLQPNDNRRSPRNRQSLDGAAAIHGNLQMVAAPEQRTETACLHLGVGVNQTFEMVSIDVDVNALVARKGLEASPIDVGDQITES